MRTLGALVSNPLILACLLGIGANQAGLELYSGFKEVVVVLSQASLPLGLLCVGAGLHLRGLTGDRTAVAMASLIKLLILPGLALLLGLILGLKQEFAAVTLIFAALPCGPAAYVLARQLGGDTPLMAKIITKGGVQSKEPVCLRNQPASVRQPYQALHGRKRMQAAAIRFRPGAWDPLAGGRAMQDDL